MQAFPEQQKKGIKKKEGIYKKNLNNTDKRSFEYSHNCWHKSRGSRCGLCGKLSLDIDNAAGHWLADGLPVNLKSVNGYS